MIRIRFHASVAAAGLLLASAALTQEPAPRPVATITQLLMVGDRAGDSGVWMETSRALTDAGEAALAAALARDVDAITSVGDQIIDACERCHEKHWIR